MKYVLFILLSGIPLSVYSKDIPQVKEYCVKMLYDRQNILEDLRGRGTPLTTQEEIDKAFNLGQYLSYRDLLYVIDYE